MTNASIYCIMRGRIVQAIKIIMECLPNSTRDLNLQTRLTKHEPKEKTEIHPCAAPHRRHAVSLSLTCKPVKGITITSEFLSKR